MTKLRFKAFGMGLFLLALAGGSSGLSGCAPHTPEQKAEWIVSRISGELDLNAAQKTKLEAVKQAILDLHKAHQADRARLVDELKQAILADHLDAKSVKAVMTQRQKLMNENFDVLFPKIADFHDSLTHAQREKSATWVEKIARHWD